MNPEAENPFPDIFTAMRTMREEIPDIIPFDLTKTPVETDSQKDRKTQLIELYNHFTSISPATLSEPKSAAFIEILISMIEELQIIDLNAARHLSTYLVRLEPTSAFCWYERGKLMFQLFVSHLHNDLEEIVGIFNKVIELGQNSEEYRDLPYWAYVFLGNIYLYRILTGEEALEQALKFYNQGYRYAKTAGLAVNDELIFDNVEIMQQILMNQFPLLLVIYNDSGQLLYEFLFQFIEVMSQDKRFIPNFTALLSAVDDHINELFKSPLTNSYLVMQNRLLVISTLYEEENDHWIKVAMIFSYLQQSAFDIDIDTILMSKVKQFNAVLRTREDVMQYLRQFYGRRDPKQDKKLDNILHEVFSEITD